MRGKIAVLALMILILVSACSNNTITGQIVSEDLLKESYPCLDTECEKNEVCIEGECFCDENSKPCLGEKGCIPKTGCCTNNECGFGKTCINKQCVFSCSNIVAVSNKVCDPVAEALVCMPGYKWCEEQFKCIPTDHCCRRFDCGRNSRCTKTQLAAEICLENGTKNCRFVYENEEKTLETKDAKATIQIISFFYDRKITILVDGQEIEMTRGSRYSLGPNERLFLARIKEYGGVCKRSD